MNDLQDCSKLKNNDPELACMQTHDFSRYAHGFSCWTPSKACDSMAEYSGKHGARCDWPYRQVLSKLLTAELPSSISSVVVLDRRGIVEHNQRHVPLCIRVAIGECMDRSRVCLGVWPVAPLELNDVSHVLRNMATRGLKEIDVLNAIELSGHADLRNAGLKINLLSSTVHKLMELVKIASDGGTFPLDHRITSFLLEGDVDRADEKYRKLMNDAQDANDLMLKIAYERLALVKRSIRNVNLLEKQLRCAIAFNELMLRLDLMMSRVKKFPTKDSAIFRHAAAIHVWCHGPGHARIV